MSFHEFVHTPFPQGLGADYETLRGFITQDIELLAAFDAASQQRPGGANNPHGRAGKPEQEEINVDNVNVDLEKSGIM